MGEEARCDAGFAHVYIYVKPEADTSGNGTGRDAAGEEETVTAG